MEKGTQAPASVSWCRLRLGGWRGRSRSQTRTESLGQKEGVHSPGAEGRENRKIKGGGHPEIPGGQRDPADMA